jgi:DNA-binding response OmpR family regulator
MINDTPLILVVDDNPQNVQFLGNLLLVQEYELGVAQNGVEALKFLEESLPDLILLDIMMPEMDGLEFCSILKSNINLSHIPVIFLTAKTETEDIVKGFEVGGVDYITKPFITAELLARVKTHLEIGYLRNLIPICANCKKVRDEEGLWNQVEVYIQKYTNTQFSHGICDDCAEELYGDSKWFKKKKEKEKEKIKPLV